MERDMEAGAVEWARTGLCRALENPNACREALRLNLNGERDELWELLTDLAHDEPLPEGVAAEAVAETMRWLPLEHARARAEQG